jgi:hypothetical protein
MSERVIMQCSREWSQKKWSRVWSENECATFKPTVNAIPDTVECPDICRHCRYANLTRLAFG